MDEIIVSICTLTYNHESYIRDALESFVNQKTNFKFEILVHDDASTDGTVEIIREYAEKYPDIVRPILQVENQFSKHEKDMIEYIFPYVRGKYIAMCEGDDFWCNNEKLQKQVDFLESNLEYIGCTHNTLLIDSISHKKKVLYSKEGNNIITFQKALIRGGENYHTSSWMYRAYLLKEYVEKRPIYFEPMIKIGVGDYPMNIFLALHGDIYYFNDVMSVYRYKTVGSWSDRFETENKQREMEAFNARREMFRLLLDEVPKDKRRYVLKEYSDYEQKNIIEMAERQERQAIAKKINLIRYYSISVQIYIIVRAYFNGIYKIYRKVRYKE